MSTHRNAPPTPTTPNDPRDRPRAVKRSRNQTVSLADLVEGWLFDREGQGAQPKTLQLYRLVGRILLDYCERHGITQAEQLDARTLNGLSIELHQRVSRITVHTYMSTVGFFLNWLAETGLVEEVPKRPRLRRVQVEKTPLSPNQMQRLIAAGRSVRDRLMLEVLCDTGLRAGELCGLEVGDVLRQGNRYFLRVSHLYGKGALPRLVPVSPSLFRRLHSYIEDVRPDCETQRLFVSERRDWRAGDYAALTPSGLRRVVRLSAQRAGIEDRVYTHLLRHSFATRALEAQAGDVLVASTLGHTSLRMLQQHYGHLTALHAYDALMKAGIMDRRR